MMGKTYAEIKTGMVTAGADCDPSCLNATEEVCTCACGGRNHGRDVEKQKAHIEYLNKILKGEA